MRPAAARLSVWGAQGADDFRSGKCSCKARPLVAPCGPTLSKVKTTQYTLL